MLRTSQYVNTDLRLHTGQDRSPEWKSGCVSSIRPPKAPPYVDFATLFLSSDFLLCSRHHYYDHQGEPTLSWFTCWFTVIWKRSVPPLLFRLVVLRSDGSLADDAPPHVFKPSRSVLMSMLILDVWPPPLAHDWIHLLHSIYCFLSDIPCTLIGVAPVLGPPIQRRQFGGLEMTNVWPALQSGRLMSSACQLAAVPLVVMPDCCVN